MATIAEMSLQDLSPSSPQSGTQAASFQSGSLHTPIATPSPASPTQGLSQAANTRPPTPTTSQAVAPQTQQTTGFPPTPSSPSTLDPSQDALQTAPTPTSKSRRKVWKKRLNKTLPWIGLVVTIIFGVPAYNFLFGSTDKQALALQVWSAGNDQRMSCWADWDHGVFSQICNDTLTRPSTAPPVKRAEESQERSLFDFWCSYITVLVVSTVLPLIGLYLSEGRAPHRHDGPAATWGDYYHRIKTRLPFSRPMWLPSMPKVTSRSVFEYDRTGHGDDGGVLVCHGQFIDTRR
ncbi:hypothetical protein M436DRAFT_65034 [Aureobasidium namibiae CBS 147.97]|uniref:Uncharacterized protein n=1 Tax=Aureobasidium namibiae CBS 147.97 TaxID=1043004 RepID=A0A074WKY7_9PEZI|nr:uncharacterized protein M436DRAFT_65034 [Aureobasidium namibiae CBS 147.97]KEQ72269.1 hypothetical protein M436DRAFT_65034 [Aureobasidium namibiae CBS 147.97]